VLDEGHGAADNLAPLLLLFRPDDVSCLLSVDQAVVAPDMFDVVELSDLWAILPTFCKQLSCTKVATFEQIFFQQKIT